MRRVRVLVIDDSALMRQVLGMPREAIACGAAAQVLPLEQIAAALLRAAGHVGARPRPWTCP